MRGPDTESPAEISRRLGDLKRYAVVTGVDLPTRRCMVDAGTGPIGPFPWKALRAGRALLWWPPTVGEQGTLDCPEGDPAAGVFTPGVYSTDFPVPDDAPGFLILFDDQSRLSYDHDGHTLRADLVEGGAIVLVADAGVRIEGDLSVTGDVAVAGKIDADGDITAGDVSLKTHPHGGVQPGAGQSGGPV